MNVFLKRHTPAFVTRLVLSSKAPNLFTPLTTSNRRYTRKPPQYVSTQLRCCLQPRSFIQAEAVFHKVATQSGLIQDQIDTLTRLTDLLLDVNRQYNLTAIRTRDAVLLKHIVDALILLPILDREKPHRIIDVGSGAGFPGIVLAVARPHWHVTLLDSARKKTKFHDLVREQLLLQNIDSVWARAEEAGRNGMHREQYDIVIARSVAEMRVLSELCIPLVSLDGCFLAQKSVDDSSSEILHAKPAIRALGGRLETISIPEEWEDLEQYLQDESDRRKKSIVVIRKVLSTPAPFPRKPGVPRKFPL